MFGVLARFLATCFGVRLGYTTEVLQEAGKWASPFLGGEKLPNHLGVRTASFGLIWCGMLRRPISSLYLLFASTFF